MKPIKLTKDHFAVIKALREANLSTEEMRQCLVKLHTHLDEAIETESGEKKQQLKAIRQLNAEFLALSELD